MARTVRQIRTKGKRRPMAAVTLATVPAVDARIAWIQALIPVGLEAFHAELQRELVSLVGARYARTGRQPGLVRWTPQAGSIYLDDQKLPLTVPRVRDRQQNREVPLTTYQQFQAPRALDTGLLQRVLGGLATRESARCAEAVPGLRSECVVGVPTVHPGECPPAAAVAGAPTGRRDVLGPGH